MSLLLHTCLQRILLVPYWILYLTFWQFYSYHCPSKRTLMFKIDIVHPMKEFCVPRQSILLLPLSFKRDIDVQSRFWPSCERILCPNMANLCSMDLNDISILLVSTYLLLYLPFLPIYALAHWVKLNSPLLDLQFSEKK